jgi:hypothetical protein
MDEFIANLEHKIENFYSDHGRQEPDTNAFVFDDSEAQAYCEGLEDALLLAKSIDN